MSQLAIASFFSMLLTNLERSGYSLDQVLSKHEGEARAAGLREKSRSMPFSLSQNDFVHGDVFWLFLQKGGQDVGCAAAKTHRVAPREFPVFLQESYERLYGMGAQDLSVPTPELLDEMYGQMAYLGEFFVTPAHRGNRNIYRNFTHALFLLAAQSFDAEWIYAFVPKAHDFYGLSRVYGYTYFEDAALFWNTVPKGRERESFCAIKRTQLVQRAHFYSRHPGAFEVPESDRDHAPSVKLDSVG